MKKILSIISFSLLLAFSGCNPFSEQFCTLSGPPNVPYLIIYPCVAGNCGPINDTASGTVGANGTFRVPQRGFTCSTLQSLARFGSNQGLALSASPASVFLPTPPTSGTITGQGFDATYALPRVDYFDSNGFLVGSVVASSVAGGGTSLQANMPDLSYVYSGTYQIKVTNSTYDGYYLNIVGTATMTGWGRDRPDTDGDGWYDDEDCAPYDPYMSTGCAETCGGTGNEPLTLCGPI
ncbi:MAG TPA: hypothetical protein VFY61_19175 [Pyrinomonadaceae bacterium]|nr:hypothetical protein [Pyrinomonadaceae bacterium]